MYRMLPALIASLMLGAPLTASAYEQLPRTLAGLTPGDFARQVRISDDPLAAAVVLSTEAGYARARTIKGARADDVHLRALIDRRTGRVTWQVWHELVHASRHTEVVAVHYVDAGAPRAIQPSAVEHEAAQCPPSDAVGACNKLTRVGFELPEQTIRAMAAAYRASSRTPWPLRFENAQGQDVTGGLAPAEAAGLIQALQAWRDRKS